MKALSLWQPWASAIAVGSKRIETRSWSTNYRGPLAIHAAKRFNRAELDTFNNEPEFTAALWEVAHTNDLGDVLPFGAVIAVCELVDCRPTSTFSDEELDLQRFVTSLKDRCDQHPWCERDLGNFGPGRFGFVLSNVRMLRSPIYRRGFQRFFNVPDFLINAAVGA